MHTSSVRTAVAVAVSLTVFAPAYAQQGAVQPKKAASRTIYSDYQVAAGTFLSIELRTSLSSGTARVGDPVEGRLLRAIVAGEEDVELVPAGAAVLGTVREVEPAGKRTPACLAFAFHVIEHPDTGSRATIRTTLLRFESERPPRAKAFPEVQLPRGADASVTLLAPLSVKIPVARSRP